MAKVPQLLYSDVKLKDKLGAGTYGSVYKINGEELSKKMGVGECFGDCWVIKRTEDFYKNEVTIREIANIVSMNHINIVNLFAAGTENFNLYFFVMPVAMSDLGAMIKRGLDKHQKDVFAFQLMAGVNYYLKEGLFHADLKSQNLLIYQEENRQVLKIADWGLGMPDVCSPKSTHYNVVTMWYKAPELLWEIPYDQNIDKWSVGCILYEIYTENVLFPGDSLVGQNILIIQQLGDPKKDPKLEAYRNSPHWKEVPNWDLNPKRFENSKIPDDISNIIRSLLVYDPKDRPDLGTILGYYSDDSTSYFAKTLKEFPESFTEANRLPTSCLQIYENHDLKLMPTIPSGITEDFIIILIDWLEDVRDTYDQSDKVFFAACYYIYQYFSRGGVVVRKELQLLGIVCFYLASIYYNYIKSIDISDMIYISDNTYTKEEFNIMMKHVLFTIGFDLYVTTPDDYIYIENSRKSPNAMKYQELTKLHMSLKHFIDNPMKKIYENVKDKKFPFLYEIKPSYKNLFRVIEDNRLQ